MRQPIRRSHRAAYWTSGIAGRTSRLVIGLFACAVAASLAPAASPAQSGEAVGQKDVAYYGDDAPDAYARERCRLDVYVPAEASDFPTVVFFHGGGLRGGSRSGAALLATTLNAAGVAVVGVDYRLSPKAKCPAYLEDAAASVAWTLEHIQDFGGDPTKVFVSGHSAGGYLAAMVTLDASYLEAFSHSTKELAGAMPISGQMVTHSTVRAEHGVTDRTRVVADKWAPSNHTRPDAPPLLLITAEHDNPGRVAENEMTYAMLQQAQHPDVAHVTISDRNHGTVYTHMGKPNDPGLAAMLAFIRKYSQKTKADG